MSMLNTTGIALVVEAALEAYDLANGVPHEASDEKGTEVMLTSIQWVLDHPSQDEFQLLYAWGVAAPEHLEPAPHVACRAGLLRAITLELAGGGIA